MSKFQLRWTDQLPVNFWAPFNPRCITDFISNAFSETVKMQKITNLLIVLQKPMYTVKMEKTNVIWSDARLMSRCLMSNCQRLLSFLILGTDNS